MQEWLKHKKKSCLRNFTITNGLWNVKELHTSITEIFWLRKFKGTKWKKYYQNFIRSIMRRLSYVKELDIKMTETKTWWTEASFKLILVNFISFVLMTSITTHQPIVLCCKRGTREKMAKYRRYYYWKWTNYYWKWRSGNWTNASWYQ